MVAKLHTLRQPDHLLPNPDKPELTIEDCKLNIQSLQDNGYRGLVKDGVAINFITFHRCRDNYGITLFQF